MPEHIHEWKNDTIDYVGVDEVGSPLHLKNVPSQVCSECHEVLVSLDTLQKSEQKKLAEKYKIQPEQITPLLLLYAPYPQTSPNVSIPARYQMDCNERMHKMLFYLWKKLDKMGYDNAYIMDTFVSARSGAVAAHLKPMCHNLKEKGLIRYKESKGVTDASEEELTEEGKKVSEDLWNRTPKDIRDTCLSVKKEFLFMDINKLITKVHKEHPEYIKKYK